MPLGPDITSRPAAGNRDLNRMYDLALAARDEALHVADLPWRLTSLSGQAPARTCLWEDTDGELVAWAALQRPWLCVDYVVHPDARTPEFESAILTWAVARLEVEAVQRDGRLPFSVSARAHDTQRIAAIETFGFKRETWCYLHMVHDLSEPIPDPEPPPGFVIRPLLGEAEVEAYVAVHRAAFGSTNMTPDWRRATLHDRAYVPELDLVAVAPDGDLAGFCVGWITPADARTRIAQIEPLGILPAHQRRGLGRALLLESLRSAKALGAVRMEVKAESYNAASQGAYKAVGFRTAYEAPFFWRDFGTPAPDPA